MARSDGRIVVRSYRLVFRLERKIYKLDRWRVPLPGGVPVRALVYAFVAWSGVFVLSRLPGVGWALGLLPPQLVWAILPGLLVFGLLKVEIDGRAPHRAMAGLIRWRLKPRVLAGLRGCASPGTVFMPFGELAVRPDWRGVRYRPARISGPATLLLRYPAEARREGGRLMLRGAGEEPMRQGKTIELPADGELVLS